MSSETAASVQTCSPGLRVWQKNLSGVIRNYCKRADVRACACGSARHCGRIYQDHFDGAVQLQQPMRASSAHDACHKMFSQ